MIEVHASPAVTQQSGPAPWTKAGLMLRPVTAAPGAPFYAVYVTPGNGIAVQYRASTGASAQAAAQISGGPGIYLDLTRSGTTFSAATSPDGVTWTTIPNSTVTLGALTGILGAVVAADAGSASGMSTITVDHVSPSPGSTGSIYPVSQTYDDAGSMLTQTYPTGETVTTSYTAQEWFAGLSTSAGNTTLVNSVSYSGVGGAAGLPSSMSLGNGVYTATASYNALLQPTDTKVTRASGTVLFEQQPTFDAVGNVSAVATLLPAGIDEQAFCYDEQDRLTWASTASGTTPCGTTNIAGSFTAAQYTQTFAYDTLNRLTSSPLGSYSYTDSAHLHGATSIGGQWTGSYDASGNLTCRAPTSTTTCAGTAPRTLVLHHITSVVRRASGKPPHVEVRIQHAVGACLPGLLRLPQATDCAMKNPPNFATSGGVPSCRYTNRIYQPPWYWLVFSGQ